MLNSSFFWSPCCLRILESNSVVVEDVVMGTNFAWFSVYMKGESVIEKPSLEGKSNCEQGMKTATCGGQRMFEGVVDSLVLNDHNGMLAVHPRLTYMAIHGLWGCYCEIMGFEHLDTKTPSHTLSGHKGWVLCIEWKAMERGTKPWADMITLSDFGTPKLGNLLELPQFSPFSGIT
ncbi:hypothetical protein K435DRAFT_803819 [Dendrothele bispora CBS 962.96]|uniref:Uncharacterized protein n=1 Tax=Dendrothele bispora (strain CBS 962.96) TaxID=1314807 RepID=A0A4S8LG59_DENBC|nr:hypothetical protein K435DRAFT_803819 [Dendrothele bispora CBS 962.96]